VYAIQETLPNNVIEETPNGIFADFRTGRSIDVDVTSSLRNLGWTGFYMTPDPFSEKAYQDSIDLESNDFVVGAIGEMREPAKNFVFDGRIVTSPVYKMGEVLLEHGYSKIDLLCISYNNAELIGILSEFDEREIDIRRILIRKSSSDYYNDRSHLLMMKSDYDLEKTLIHSRLYKQNGFLRNLMDDIFKNL
jgi:hypothetical protein